MRLVKWWANLRKGENSAFKCKSFLLELLVAHLADSGVELKDYPYALEQFFSYIVRTGLEKRVAFDDYYSIDTLPNPTGDAIEVFDPVNAENNVTSRYSVSDRDALVAAAEEAADAIREASLFQHPWAGGGILANRSWTVFRVICSYDSLLYNKLHVYQNRCEIHCFQNIGRSWGHEGLL